MNTKKVANCRRGCICVGHEWIQGETQDVEFRSDVDASWIDANDARLFSVDIQLLGDSDPDRISMRSIEFSAEARFDLSQYIRLLQCFAVNDHAMEACQVDVHEGPMHIGGVAVIDPPAVREATFGAVFLEFNGGDEQFHGRLIRNRHVQHGFLRLEHGHHHWGDDPAIGREDVLHGPDVFIEAEIGCCPGVELGNGLFKHGGFGIHGGESTPVPS